MVLGPTSERRKDCWSLGLGNRTVHGGARRCLGQGSISDQCLDQMDLPCHSRKYGGVAHLHSNICNRRTATPLLDRVRWSCPTPLPVTSLLPHGGRHSAAVSVKRHCVEVCQAHVQAASISPRAGDSKIQHTRLSATDGAVPKSHSQGPTGTADAETERVCFQPVGRESDEGAASVRHDARERKVRGDDEFEAGCGKRKVKRKAVTLFAALYNCYCEQCKAREGV